MKYNNSKRFCTNNCLKWICNKFCRTDKSLFFGWPIRYKKTQQNFARKNINTNWRSKFFKITKSYSLFVDHLKMRFIFCGFLLIFRFIELIMLLYLIATNIILLFCVHFSQIVNTIFSFDGSILIFLCISCFEMCKKLGFANRLSCKEIRKTIDKLTIEKLKKNFQLNDQLFKGKVIDFSTERLMPQISVRKK